MITENFSYLFQYLKKEKINIDQNEFVFQLNSHPDSPSLLAISDTLTFFDIDNLVTKINFEDIIHLPQNFIALLQNNNDEPFFTMVEKEGAGFKFLENKKAVNLSDKEFEKVFQNIILLAEKEVNDVIEVNPKFNGTYLLLSAVVFFISFLVVTKATLNVYLFSLISIIGVYLSLEAILKEIGIQSKFSESVCNLTATTDCDTVIKSKGFSFLEKFNYSNFSITFFASQLFFLIVMQVATNVSAFFDIQFVLLLLSIPITFLSFYHQIKVAKKWCTICLMIIGLLYLEFCIVYSSTTFTWQLDLPSVLVFLILFAFFYFFTNTFKNSAKSKNEQEIKLFAVNRFKRNFTLFRLALNESDKALIELNQNSLIVGNPNSNLTLTLITNPFCKFCKEAHQIIDKIYKAYKEDICINFQFNFDIEKNDAKSKEIHNKLLQLYFNEGQDAFMLALHNWFENNQSPKVTNEVLSELKVNEILNQQYQSNELNKTNFTPCFIINGSIFPKIYSRKDLIYFIPELINEVTE